MGKRLAGKTSLTAPIRPEAPSETTSSGARSPRATMLSKNPVQTSVDSLAPASRPTNTGRPSLVIPHAARTGSDRAPSCMRKSLPSKNRYSSATSARSRVFQRSNSSLTCSHTRETVDFDRAASAPRASARLASTSRTDKPRTNPASRDASKIEIKRLSCRSRPDSPLTYLLALRSYRRRAACRVRFTSRRRVRPRSLLLVVAAWPAQRSDRPIMRLLRYHRWFRPLAPPARTGGFLRRKRSAR